MDFTVVFIRDLSRQYFETMAKLSFIWMERKSDGTLSAGMKKQLRRSWETVRERNICSVMKPLMALTR